MQPDVTTEISPDSDQMYQHLNHLFGRALDGLVEIAWTNAKGAPVFGRLFELDQLEDAVEFAANENRASGVNVYVGGALRKATTQRTGNPSDDRTEDDDFLEAWACWSDFDKDGAARAAFRLAEPAPPTFGVVTGRHPHQRAQFYFDQESCETDPAALSAQLRGIASVLGGDTTVCNPGRILRLAGSIAWPYKPGRIVEMTSIAKLGPRKTIYYLPGALAKAYPPLDLHQVQIQDVGITDIIGRLSVRKVMAAIRRGDQWHNHMLKLTGHWVERGLSDDEILATAESLTLAGYTADQTRADMARMIRGAREKWSIPDADMGIPMSEQGQEVGKPFSLKDWPVERFEPGKAPPVKWLCKGTVPLGEPVLLAGMGGIGKSFLELDMALAIALGITGIAPKRALGGEILCHGSVVMLTAEDNAAAIHRRLDKIDPQGKRSGANGRLIVVPMPNAGGPRPLIAPGKNGPMKTEFFADLKRQLSEIEDLRLVIIDPLNAFVTADISSDTPAAQFMWSSFAEICAEQGATVLASHHIRKDGMNRISNADDAREAIRGVTAIVDASRLSYVLWKVQEDEAKEVCEWLERGYEHGCVVKGAVVKANDEANWDIHTYVRQETGLLVEKTHQVAAKAEQTANDDSFIELPERQRIMRAIDEKWRIGNPYSMAPNTGPRCAANWMMRTTRKPRRTCERLLSSWFDEGYIVEEVVNSTTKMRGLRVAKWPW